MSLSSILAGALPAIVGATIGAIVGQRRLVARNMPDDVGRWRTLGASDRWRIRWAVTRGRAVGDPALASLAVAFARMRRTLWERLTTTKYVALGLVGVAGVVVSFGFMHGDEGVPYGTVIVLAMVAEAIVAPGRGARLARAEQRNQRLAAPG